VAYLSLEYVFDISSALPVLHEHKNSLKNWQGFALDKITGQNFTSYQLSPTILFSSRLL